MTRALVVVVVVLVGCTPAPRPDPDASAVALQPIDTPDAGPALANDAGGDAEPEGPPSFEFEPAELMVYRSTAVQFRAVPPPGRAAATCTWSFGDGSPPEDGCEVSHTFDGGTADQRVTLTMNEGTWRFEATRIVPLERLPVSAGVRDVVDPGALPPRPKDGPTSYRAVLLADLVGAGADVEALATVTKTIVELGPDIVVVVGGAADPDESSPWELARARLSEPLVAARIPVLWGVSPADIQAGAEVRRPVLGPSGDVLELADGAAFPERWSLAFRGTYLVFVAGAAQSDESLDWLRARLAEAQIYESRVVFSYLPIHPFSDVGVRDGQAQTLGPKFKVYELLLRARTTAFVSAGHRAYFKGRYGALPVVSVGAATGQGARLAGHDFEQAPSIVVMDVEGGVPVRIFALEGPGYDTVLDEGYLPDTVEVYTR